jgi:hypothetical protein
MSLIKIGIIFFIGSFLISTRERYFHFLNKADPTVPTLYEYVASTPGDQSLIKSYLHIPESFVADFIRWDLKMDSKDRFDLTLNYGESKPNTLGFKDHDITVHYQGHYSLERIGTIKEDVFNFISDDQTIHFKAIKINGQLLHLLNDEHKLMVGNGGWSFTLNRTAEPGSSSSNLPVRSNLSKQLNPSIQEIYDGRTPAAGIAKDHALTKNLQSFKIKWRFILNRDPNTLEPTTYTMRNIINNEPKDITGRWKVVRGTSENPKL